MGFERSVTRWYVHRQLLVNEIATLEKQVASSLIKEDATLSPSERDSLQKLVQIRERLRVLGNCPRPMMG